MDDVKRDHAKGPSQRVSKGDIGRTWFGSALSEPVRSRLAKAARHLHMPADTVVFSEGEDMPFFMIVADGRVGLSSHVPGRGEEMVLTVEPGDVVGWSSLVDPHLATLTATAIVDADAITIDASALRKMLKVDSEFAAEVLARALESLAHRLTVTRWQLMDMYRPAESSYIEPEHWQGRKP